VWSIDGLSDVVVNASDNSMLGVCFDISADAKIILAAVMTALEFAIPAPLEESMPFC
jgi:hypothetical protein